MRAFFAAMAMTAFQSPRRSASFTFAGSVSGQVIDTAGVVLQPICGSEAAIWIY